MKSSLTLRAVENPRSGGKKVKLWFWNSIFEIHFCCFCDQKLRRSEIFVENKAHLPDRGATGKADQG
jgi:hypothetical protein